MGDAFREGHYVLGIEGLALLRGGAQRRLDSVRERVDEMEQIAARLDEPPYATRRTCPRSR